MKTTVTKTEFRDTFFNMGRKDQFTYDALGALFDFLEEMEEGTGEEMEFDCIALCCDFSEHENAVDCVSDHGYPCEYDDDDSKEETALEYLRDNTMVIEFDGGIIIQAF